MFATGFCFLFGILSCSQLVDFLFFLVDDVLVNFALTGREVAFGEFGLNGFDGVFGVGDEILFMCTRWGVGEWWDFFFRSRGYGFFYVWIVLKFCFAEIFGTWIGDFVFLRDQSFLVMALVANGGYALKFVKIYGGRVARFWLLVELS